MNGGPGVPWTFAVVFVAVTAFLFAIGGWYALPIAALTGYCAFDAARHAVALQRSRASQKRADQ